MKFTTVQSLVAVATGASAHTIMQVVNGLEMGKGIYMPDNDNTVCGLRNEYLSYRDLTWPARFSAHPRRVYRLDRLQWSAGEEVEELPGRHRGAGRGDRHRAVAA